MKFINDYLENLAPYSLASHKVWEVSDSKRKSLLKLDWNEATIPPSPNVRKRLKQLVDKEDIYFLYPCTNNTEIIQRLSSYTKQPMENIQYFASSDLLQEYLITMCITKRDPILILGPTYDNFRLTCQARGAFIHYFNYDQSFTLNEKHFREEIKRLAPKLVYICNPNNPSGTLLSKIFLTKLIADFQNTLFLIDEAYYEFSGETIADQTQVNQNLFVSRTFSKAFALANFRAGYLISHVNNIQQISKIRNSKNFTTFAQEAVLGVLSDIEYMRDFVDEVIRTKEWFKEELSRLSFVEKVYTSHANFVLVDFISFEDKMKVFNHLEENHIFVRNLQHSQRLVNTLRLTIGTTEQMLRVSELLRSIK